MIILAFDISSKCTGWAVSEDGEYCDSGIIIECKDPVKFYLQVKNLIELWKPSVVRYELPNRFYNAILVIAKLIGIVELAAINWSMLQERELTMQPYFATAIKKLFTGSGKATKQDMMNKVLEITGLEMDNDQADAVALSLI